MLPTRAYVDNIPRVSPPGLVARPFADVHGTLVVAVAEADVDRFPAGDFTRYPVRTTNEALRLIDTARPRVVVVDWDVDQIDGPRICTAARQFGHTGVLVMMQKAESAPAALKAGCHAILLKPCARNLVAARIGRMSRELPITPVAARAATMMLQTGMNRVWPETYCPTCHAPSATSFEFASHRRMWYACLRCDAVWLGGRQE